MTQKRKTFQLEQIAFYLPFKTVGEAADTQRLLSVLGWDFPVKDVAIANGFVREEFEENVTGALAYRYQNNLRPLEIEALSYESEVHWLSEHLSPVASHIGMHVDSIEEMNDWETRLNEISIRCVQRLTTTSHSNPAISGKRTYTYRVFETRHLIGFDLKFILRHIHDHD